MQIVRRVYLIINLTAAISFLSASLLFSSSLVFDLCGKKFFAFGGTSSHDIDDGILEPEVIPDDGGYSFTRELIKEYNDRTKNGEMLRVNHLSWWAEEMPSDDEMEFGL